jgi:hypothetical protein
MAANLLLKKHFSLVKSLIISVHLEIKNVLTLKYGQKDSN